MDVSTASGRESWVHSGRTREFASAKPQAARVIAVLAMLASLLACGCTGPLAYVHNGFKVGPNYQEPAAPVADEWIDSKKDPCLTRGSADYSAWWMEFHDPVLDSLVQTAYKQNLDLKTAATRILEAKAQRNIAVGNLFPQKQTASVDYVHAQISQSFSGLPFPNSLDAWSPGFNASWELDFWAVFAARSRPPTPILTPPSRTTTTPS